jgi:hypothetical protein
VLRNINFAAQEQCFVNVALVASILLLRAFLGDWPCHLGDLGGVDLAALRASGRSSGSIWPLEKHGPVLRNVDFAAQEQCFVNVALVASILLLRAFLGALVASIWLP